MNRLSMKLIRDFSLLFTQLNSDFFQSDRRKNFRNSKPGRSTAFCCSSACKLCCKTIILKNLSIKWCQTLFPLKTNFWGIEWKDLCKSKLEAKRRDNDVPTGFAIFFFCPQSLCRKWWEIRHNKEVPILNQSISTFCPDPFSQQWSIPVLSKEGPTVVTDKLLP